ncbi:MAG: hypothetical protein AB1416_05650 [Actinomycetota bacterium]
MPRPRKLALASAAALAGTALAFGVPSAASAAEWTKLGRDTSSNLPVAGLALDSNRVLATWLTPAPSGDRAQAATFAPALAAAGRAPQVAEIVADGWAHLNDPLLLGTAGGGFQVLLTGMHSAVTGDPLNGDSFAPRNPDGTFGAPAPTGIADGAGDAILAADGATPLWATTQAGGLRLHRGAVQPTASDVAAAAGQSADLHYIPRFGRDGAGRYWLAWFAQASAPRPSGIFIAQVDSATGTLAGPAALAPASGSPTNNSLSIPMACSAQTCRIVYHETGANALTTGRIVSWAPGEAAPTPVVTAKGAAGNIGAAYRGDGRLWVAWYQTGVSGTYKVTLGDARGAGGQVDDLGAPPHPTLSAAYAVSAIDAGGNLVLVTNFLRGSALAQWATVTGPPNTAGIPDTTGIPNPQVIRRGPAIYVVPKKPSLRSLRRKKCVNVRVQTTRPAAIRVAIFSGRKSIRVFGAAVVRFTAPGKRLVCIRVPLRARTFDVRQPFRFAFAFKAGARPKANAPATVTTTNFTTFG